MKKISVVDVKKYIDSKLAAEMAEKGLEMRAMTLGIVLGKDRVILSDEDAVHDVFSMDGHIEVDLFDRDKEGEHGRLIAMVPSARVKVGVQDLVALCDTEFATAVELTAFVRRFGRRIEENYSILLDSIKEIGLVPEDYPR